MRILLVEDDPMVGRAMHKGLSEAGFTVDWVRDGQTAQDALSEAQHDLLVLDLGLPRRDGLALLAQARLDGRDLPVLVASARDAVVDRVGALEAGADDYLTKPFDLSELVARARALLRRRGGQVSGVLRAGALVLDPQRHEVTLAGQPVALSAREFAVLEVLMQRPGAVVAREKIEASVYGWGEQVDSNAVEVHLHHLRRKLGTARIRNVRGVGYRVSEEG